MQILLVADLHYDLPKFDWVLEQAGDVDLVVVAGDLLDVGSAVPLDAQITVSLEYLRRLRDIAAVVACSGNHDLDHRTDTGEKATGWITEATEHGVVVDGETTRLGGWTITACAWWEGPTTLAGVERTLEQAQRKPDEPWMWVYHGPPEGPLSWTGRRHFGDPELPRLLEAHRPDLVLSGHIHQAPFTDDGDWSERRGDTWLFNAGYQLGPLPAHIFFDLDGARADWWSFDGSGSVDLSLPASATTGGQ